MHAHREIVTALLVSLSQCEVVVVEKLKIGRKGIGRFVRVRRLIMPRSCPPLTTDLVPPETEPLLPTAPWQPAPEPPPRTNSSHFFMYVPPLEKEIDQQALRAVLRSNQFPSDPAACNRTLVLFDDALSAGLGYSARLLAIALLVAVQERRVLINLSLIHI